MGPVLLETQGLLRLVIHRCGTVGCLHAHGVDDGVWAPSARVHLQGLLHAGHPQLVAVQWHRAVVLLGHLEPDVVGIDDEDLLGTHLLCRHRRHLPHRPSSPDGHAIALLDLTPVGSSPAGGEDVGDEQDLVVGERVGHLHMIVVRVGNAHELRLAACETAVGVRVAVETGG